MSIATYSPGEVNLYLAILHQVTGFSPDSLIRITRDENYFVTSTGASGKAQRLVVPSKLYTLEVSLSQTSPSNAVLSGLATLDHMSNIGTFPVFAKDGSGDSLFLATTCWIEKPAEASYSDSIETRTWTIRCSEMVFGLAGNGGTDEISDTGRLGTLISQFGGNMGVF